MNKNLFVKTCFENAYEIRKYHKNEILFNENDLCNYLAIIKRGNIRITSYAFNGNEMVFKNLTANDCFGESLLFSSYPYYKGTITSISDSEIAYIKKDVVLQLLSNPSLLEIYLNMLSEEILLTKEKQRILSFHNVQDRLLYWLHLQHKIAYKSITDLAKELAVSRESLSRTLKSLCEKNLITMKGKCIALVK